MKKIEIEPVWFYEMLRILLYLQYIQKQDCILNSTHKILIKSQMIFHWHTKNPVDDLYKNVLNSVTLN